MQANTRSALICALLLTVSVLAMRYGRDEGYIPADDYKETAREVFFMYDERRAAPSAVSSYSANNILATENREPQDTGQTEQQEVLPPVISAPGQIEVFGEGNT